MHHYLTTHADDLSRTIHSEKQIQVHVTPGVIVDDRTDLSAHGSARLCCAKVVR